MTTATLSNLGQLAGDYTLDPTHTRIGFVARHAMVTKVRGAFNEFEGSIHIDADDLSKSSAKLVIKVESIDTRNADRDGHLRTNDFLDAQTYPEITFASTGVKQVDDTTVRVTGDLTIKDVTKPVELALEFNGVGSDPWGGTRAGFTAKTEISRKEFGVDLEMPLEGGGVVVGDKINVTLEIEAVLQQG